MSRFKLRTMLASFKDHVNSWMNFNQNEPETQGTFVTTNMDNKAKKVDHNLQLLHGTAQSQNIDKNVHHSPLIQTKKFLYATASNVGTKIRKKIEESNILADFHANQNKFIKDKQRTTHLILPPWKGCANEDSVKEKFLRLSSDKQNFLRSPPSDSNQFNSSMLDSAAKLMIMEDPNVGKMRFELVPKIISEKTFWRNYFYRVNLICQAHELSFVIQKNDYNTADEVPNEFSNFVCSTIQKASQKFAEASSKIKKSIEEIGITSKDQENSCILPWIGRQNEEALRRECLMLSADQNNFTCSPPEDVDFQFDYETSYHVAAALMEQDPKLKEIRFKLVPEVIKEEDFFRNYLYRVYLICQDRHEDLEKTRSSNHSVEEWEKELKAKLDDYNTEGDNKSDSENCWEKDFEELLEENVDLNRLVDNMNGV